MTAVLTLSGFGQRDYIGHYTRQVIKTYLLVLGQVNATLIKRLSIAFAGPNARIMPRNCA